MGLGAVGRPALDAEAGRAHISPTPSSVETSPALALYYYADLRNLVFRQLPLT